MDFREADRRYVEFRRQYETGNISNEEFRSRLKDLMVQDLDGRRWAKSVKTGEWHYHNGHRWVPAAPPGYVDQPSPPRTSPAEMAPSPRRESQSGGYSPLAGKAPAPAPTKYAYPEGDWVWYRHSTRDTVPECPEHGILLRRAR